jgi:4'-phosphopantetheinyl transferase EntD
MQRNFKTESRIKLLYPEHTGICFSNRADFAAPLFPEELVGTDRMVKKRVLEFSHGRECARAVLEIIGQPAVAIPRGNNREPLWPAGIVGSISHSGSSAAAVAVSKKYCLGIGLDIESDKPLDKDLIPMICRVDENVESNVERAKLLFSIKESIYKCIFPTVGKIVDFLEVKVCLDEVAGRYTACSDSGRQDLDLLKHLHGSYCVYEDMVISAAWLSIER